MTSILDAIGGTPLIRVDDVWLKCEHLNPSGSVKARMARHAITRAAASGALRPGDTIVEASSGNTGNAMAMVAAVLGYRMVVVTAAGLSPERTAISRAFGAEVVEVGDFHVGDALARARELGERDGWFHPGQFEGEWNVEANATGLGPEILGQLEGATPDAVVCGIGTGGTLVGVGRAFRAAHPGCVLLGVEPAGSRTLCCGEIGRHRIEGIADGFVPGIVARHRAEIDDVVPVDDAEALAESARLARAYGLFVGPSTGAHLVAARRWLAEHPGRTVVTFASDKGEKYLSERAGDALGAVA